MNTRRVCIIVGAFGALMFMVWSYGLMSPLRGAVCSTQLQQGLDILLRDQTGRPVIGAVVTGMTAEWRETEKFFEWPGQGRYHGLSEATGLHTFAIVKEGFKKHTGTVFLTRNACHVETQYRTIIMIIER